MSRASRQQKAEAVLKSLEDQYTTDLVAELRRCAAGSWGIFGQNDNFVAQQPVLRLMHMGAAANLIERGEAIVELRETLGSPSHSCPSVAFWLRRSRGVDHSCWARVATIRNSTWNNDKPLSTDQRVRGLLLVGKAIGKEDPALKYAQVAVPDLVVRTWDKVIVPT